jgi:hypothetical protein
MKLSVLLLAAVAAAVTSPPFTHVQAGCAVTKERGCYRDNSSIDRILGPALPGRPAPMQAMTRAICAQICLDQKCALAGVEYGQQCFCGDRLNYPPVASSGCTTSCRGNSSETCGGTSAIDVYEFLCSGAPVPIPGPAPPPPSPTPNPPAHGGGCPGRSQCQCPCSPSSLCHSLPLGAARDFNATMKRVIAFHEGHAIYNGSANEWNLWDWDTVTTVVTGMVAGGDDPTGWRGHRCHNISQALLCQAHKRGVRVVGFTYWPWNTSPEDWEQLANATKRQLWVEGAVATAVRLGLDGYNVDIEGQMNASLRDALTNLTCELRAALTMAIPGASVSFDLAVDPGAYPPILRGYDYVGLARCLDVVTPMAYDMIGPVTEGTMMHHANAPLAGVLRGIGKLAINGLKPRSPRLTRAWCIWVVRVVPEARSSSRQDRHVAPMVCLRLCVRHSGAWTRLRPAYRLPPQQPGAGPGSRPPHRSWIAAR